MISAQQAKDTISEQIINFVNQIKPLSTLTQIEDKLIDMIQQVIDIVKPNHRIVLV